MSTKTAHGWPFSRITVITDRVWNAIRPMMPPMLVGGQGAVGHALPAPADRLAVSWQAGDWAVYRKSKRSSVPGPRASSVMATRKGETYAYVVEKFWVVDQVTNDGQLIMRTTRGKTHRIAADDPNLSKPGWIARLRWGQRFRAIEARSRQSTIAA